ncbi:probable G-protein coupled receptor 83 [Gigantopelta aegis]|uniref:probable G-protein coupled receptor 83 n=1 Tax=Gigantopelta aegis TaxID=1735272 RepID=UPI001B888ABC|nr:probable G-protein coupled receptor 83 [Gigantopelta aegis]
MTNAMESNFTDLTLKLEQLNDKATFTLLPAVVFLIVVGLVSFYGNILVCYIFIFQMKRGTQNFLVSTLGVLSLISTLVGIPASIYSGTHRYTFYSLIGCRWGHFLNLLFLMATMFVLLIIALDRYLKICRPFKCQLKLRQTRIAVAVALCLATAFSLPRYFMYEIKSVKMMEPGVMGTYCLHIEDLTIVALYHAGKIVIFLSLIIAMTFLYARIAWTSRNRKNIINSFDDINRSAACKLQEQKELRPSNSLRLLADRATVIGLIVTVVFVVSFLPYIAIRIVITVDVHFPVSLTGTSLVVYDLFDCTYFINTAANPIIYGVLNTHFRQEVLKLMSRCRGQTERVGQYSPGSSD